MTTYTFTVVVEPDDDRWHAYCPALAVYGAATWGRTRDEACRRIDEVIRIVIDELREDGIPVPEGLSEPVAMFNGKRVAVTV